MADAAYFDTGWHPNEREFALLLQDRTFVDYFNIFLSLPAFPQRVLFKYSSYEFILDPPLEWHQHNLNQAGIVKWLLQERLPYYTSSEIFVDFLLSKELSSSELKIVRKYRKFYEPLPDAQKMMHERLGNATGMCRFERYLSGTAGENVIQFWRDATRFLRCSNESPEKLRRLREIQIKYFMQFSRKDDRILFQGIHTVGGSEADPAELARQIKTIKQLQKAMMFVLKEYWLQKYMLHCIYEQTKKAQQEEARRQKVIEEDANGTNDSLVVPEIHHETAMREDYEFVYLPNPSALFKYRHVRTVDEAMKLKQELDEKGTDERSMMYKRLSNLRKMFSHSLINELLDVKDFIVEAAGPEGTSSLITRPTQNYVTKGTKTTRDAIEEEDEDEESVSEAENNEKASDEIPNDVKNNDDRVDDDNNDTKSSSGTAQVTLPALPGSVVTEGTPHDGTTTHDPLGRDDKLPSIGTAPSPSSLTSSCALDQSKSATGILPQISPFQSLQQEFKEVIAKVLNSVTLTKYYYQSGPDTYRITNSRVVNAIATDKLAGGPFLRFLRRHQNLDAMHYLHFWHDAQVYICTQVALRGDVAQRLRIWRAQNLVADFISPSGPRHVDMGRSLNSCLIYQLRETEGDAMLKHTQDAVAEVLRRFHKMFVEEERVDFLEKAAERQITRQGTQRRPGHLDDSQDRAMDSMYWFKQLRKRERAKWMMIRDGFRPECNVVEVREGMATARAEKAMYLAQYMTNTADAELDENELEYDEKDDEGSMAIQRKICILKREVLKRRQEERARAAEEAKRLDDIRFTKTCGLVSEGDEDTKMRFYTKPIRIGGRWVERPKKPKSFSELLKDPVQIAFFRRFLMSEGAQTALSFWLAVQELRGVDGRAKQNKVAKIVKRFFDEKVGRGTRLQCPADIIREIPKMEKVTPAMLISAQACVLKTVEERWVQKYMDTFPAEEDLYTDSLLRFRVPEGSQVEVYKPGKKVWAKERTKFLWLRMCRAVTNFRRGIMDRWTQGMFSSYLRLKYIKDAIAQQNDMQGMAVRKVIRNRLVQVDKLLADLGFLVESERYRDLADEAIRHANMGSYSVEDEQMIERKARTVIECFIDSEIPPRVQINISQDTADRISETFEGGIIERGLFHEATMSIMPVMLNLWNKFCTYRFNRVLKSKVHRASESEIILAGRETPHAAKPTPNFFNIDLNQVKRIHAHHHGEEPHPRLLFSLAHGIRFIIPIAREDFYGYRMRGHGSFMASGASLAGSIGRRVTASKGNLGPRGRMGGMSRQSLTSGKRGSQHQGISQMSFSRKMSGAGGALSGSRGGGFLPSGGADSIPPSTPGQGGFGGNRIIQSALLE